MNTGKPTVVRRQLGLLLRRLREEAGKSQAEAARAISQDRTRLSRVEVGSGSFSTDQLAALLDFLGVEGHDRAEVLALGQEARRRRPRRSYTDALPGSFRRLIDLEADATQIRSYEMGVIPGLIQSPDYLRSVIGACDGVLWETSAKEVEGRSAFRIERQQRVLDAERAKTLSFVLAQEALRHVVGSPSVMRGQLLHLLQLSEKHPNLTIQVLSADTPGNPLLGGGIMVLDFDDAPRIGFATAVYGPSTYHDDERDTHPLVRAFEQVRRLALSPEGSRDLLIEQLKEY